MNKRDRIRRALAFYTSVVLFCILLPVILSYALGYKIDFRAFKIYKTGILYIASSPTGASIYVNGKKHTDFTPARIEEMRPGAYKVEVRRDGFYPWENELLVRPNMVTKVESIVLFPVTQDMKMIARYPVAAFAISDKNYIYHMTDRGLFMSNMDGSNLKKISSQTEWPKDIRVKKFSPSKDKILCFSNREIFVIYLNLDKALSEGGESARVERILIPEYPIEDVFWHSDSGYMIVVTERDISVVELRGEGARNIVLLYKFNSAPKSLYYDIDNDSLYFTDNKKAEGLKEGTYLYRLDLRKNFFGQLMHLLLKKEEVLNREK